MKRGHKRDLEDGSCRKGHGLELEKGVHTNRYVCAFGLHQKRHIHPP